MADILHSDPAFLPTAQLSMRCLCLVFAILLRTEARHQMHGLMLCIGTPLSRLLHAFIPLPEAY